MPKYLMFDHGGVLDGEYVVEAKSVTENDLDLGPVEGGGRMVLKNGVEAIRDLTVLVNQHGYQIVYHSANAIPDQIKLHQSLVVACRSKGLSFPAVRAMPVLNKSSGSPDTNPRIGTARFNAGGSDINILTAEFSTDESGKRSVRRALQNAFATTSAIDIPNSHVFDDGPSIIRAAREDGYIGHEIGSGPSKETLFAALKNVLTSEQRNLASAAVTAIADSAPSLITPASCVSSTSSSFFSQSTQAVVDRAEAKEIPLENREYKNLPEAFQAFLQRETSEAQESLGLNAAEYWATMKVGGNARSNLAGEFQAITELTNRPYASLPPAFQAFLQEATSEGRKLIGLDSDKYWNDWMKPGGNARFNLAKEFTENARNTSSPSTLSGSADKGEGSKCVLM